MEELIESRVELGFNATKTQEDLLKSLEDLIKSFRELSRMLLA